MGGCFSVGRRVDLTGNTFSHYSLSSQSEHIDLYPGFRYVETEASVCEDSTSAWRRSSVPLLDSWDTRPKDSVSVTSSLSPSHTLASEVCEETEARGSQTTKSRFSSFSSSSSAQQKHRDKRAFFWNRALVRLRNSFRSGNKISSDSSLPPRQKASSSSAQENSACVRLSTSTSVEEDFV